MNENDIKKALECCLKPTINSCVDCPYNNNGALKCNIDEMHKDALNLINKLEKDCTDIANDYQEMGKFYNEEAEKNEQLKDKVTELESENKELRVVVDIANERTYRKKFTDEWRKEYQKELDKQGNEHIAGYPDFDLVYKLYFEQKDRIAELKSENELLRSKSNDQTRTK